jgi:hypothetical protein
MLANSYVLAMLTFLQTYMHTDRVVPVRGRRGPQGCETSRTPQFLDNRLTDGGDVVSLKRRPRFTPRKILDTHFCLEAESTPWP